MNAEKLKDIRFIVLFLVIIVIAFAYLTQASLAKYRKHTEGNVEGTIAHWNIKLNGENIHRTMTNTITPTLVNNQYTKDGVIAPGTQGYFDLEIDATDVDVDFTYTILFESLDNLEDIRVTSYQIGGNTYTVDGELTGTITHNTGPTTIRFNMEWYDGDDNTMDNSMDTETAKNYSAADVKVTINFVQVT
jgi:hypothetical protein